MSNYCLERIDQLSLLSKEDLQEAKNFASKIDITNHVLVLRYGESYQNKIAKASESISKLLADKVKYPVKAYFNQLSLATSEFSLKCSQNANLNSLMLQFLEVRNSLWEICNELESYGLNLMHEKDELSIWKSKLNDYYRRITQYIIAGNLRIDQIRKNILPELEKERAFSVISAEKYNGMIQCVKNFEDKLTLLGISQQQVIQLIIQVNLRLEDDDSLIKSIRQISKTTIPEWEGAIIIALGIEYSNNSSKVKNRTIASFNEVAINNKNGISKAAKQMAKKSSGVDWSKIQDANENLSSFISSALSD